MIKNDEALRENLNPCFFSWGSSHDSIKLVRLMARLRLLNVQVQHGGYHFHAENDHKPWDDGDAYFSEKPILIFVILCDWIKHH